MLVWHESTTRCPSFREVEVAVVRSLASAMKKGRKAKSSHMRFHTHVPEDRDGG